MKKVVAGILSICIIGAVAATLYVLNSRTYNNASRVTSEKAYKEINKSFSGFIFSEEGKLIKEVPVKISGKQYNETTTVRDYFQGTIEIEGEIVDISSTKDKNAAFADFDAGKYYSAVNTTSSGIANEKGVIKLNTAVVISKDFKTVYGYTSNLRRNHGEKVFFKSDKNFKTPQDDYIKYIKEASKRVDLYVAVLKAAFQQENGGKAFIAVKEETLIGFKEEKSKQDIVDALKALATNVYWYEGVKDDKTLFKFDKDGSMLGTINGSVLSIKVEEYKDDEAVIEATSWFGNLGAVFPKYKAVYKDGKWELKLLSMAIS